MNDLMNDHIVEKRNKKVFNLKAEKLVREASDTFIYFKDYELALKQVNAVLKIEPNHTKALLLKGDILLCLDKDKKALECYAMAIESDCHCAQAYGSMAGVLDMMDKPEEALEYCNKAFENATAKDKQLLTSLFDQKLSILHSLGRYKEAQEILQLAINSLPEEDSSYLVSCYQDSIAESQSHEIAAKMTLQLVY